MKPLVIYHANCTDGFGAAFAAWMKFGDNADYLPASYGDKQFSNPQDIRELVDGREIYILDFSFSKQVMDQIIADAVEVVWLDHHKTAFEMWCGKAPDLFFTLHREQDKKKHIVLDDCKSGALLAWRFFHPATEVPLLIQHIDDRDRWQFKLEGSKEFHAALQLQQPWSFEQWDSMFNTGPACTQIAYERLYNVGNALLRAQDITVERQAKQACMSMLAVPQTDGSEISYRGLAVNTQNHISETGHVLANQSGTYGLCWYVGADGKVKCSLRSNGDYDVSAIAKAFGGGGHRNASGMEVTLEQLQSWLV